MIINMTPHPITVEKVDGTRITFQPSGMVPRVTQTRETGSPIEGIPVTITVSGSVVGLPSRVEGTTIIVSSMVGQVAMRDDVVAPDTGATAVRDAVGHIVAVRGFVRFSA